MSNWSSSKTWPNCTSLCWMEFCPSQPAVCECSMAIYYRGSLTLGELRRKRRSLRPNLPVDPLLQDILPPGAMHRWRRNAGDTHTQFHYYVCHALLENTLVLLLSTRRCVTAGITDPLPRRNLLKVPRLQNVITISEFIVGGRFLRLETLVFNPCVRKRSP